MQLYPIIYNNLQTVWNDLSDEEKSGSIDLNNEHKQCIFNALEQVDSAPNDPTRKLLLSSIAANPNIARVALAAMYNNEKYKALDQELLSTILEDLQGKLLSCTNSQNENTVLNDWLEAYKNHFDSAAIAAMDTDTLFHFAEILAKFPEEDAVDLQSLIERLPLKGQKYVTFLKDIKDQPIGYSPFADLLSNFKEDHPIALAHLISYKKYPITEITGNFSEEELLHMVPYLRYANFRGLDTGLIEKLLENSQKLNHLLISNPRITSLKLKELPLCQKLNCLECKALQTLPELPLCQEFNCSKCEALQTLPELPLCQEFNCIGCTALLIMPSGLPACRLLTCFDCPLLTELPEVPENCQVYTGQSQNLSFVQMRVDTEKLTSDPKALLLELGRSFLLNKKPFPNIVYYSEGKPSEAIDIGGVRRTFVTDLLQEIFKNEGANHLATQGNGWPGQEKLNDEMIDCYRTLGKLLALCYPLNSAFKPGNVFCENVYQAIAVFQDPEDPSSQEWISNFLLVKEIPSGVLKLCNKNAFDLPDDDGMSLSFAQYLFDEDWAENRPDIDVKEFFGNPDNRSRLKVIILEQAISDSSLQAVCWMAKEMKKSLGSVEWNNLRTDPRLMERIQGVVTQEAVLKALEWKKADPVEEAKHDATRRFMEDWIGRADADQLRSFIYTVKGNNALSEKIKLKMQTYNRGKSLPATHTCFFSLELSAEYGNQEDFHRRMQVFLKYAVGFDFA